MTSMQEKLLSAVGNGELLSIAEDLYLNINDADERSSIGKELAALHNEGKLNAPTEFLRLKNTEQSCHFFTIRNIFGDALPDINAPVIDVMECVKHLTEQAGNDMTASMLFSSFMDYCQANTERSNEALELSTSQSEQWKDFVSAAIISGARLDLQDYVGKAIELAKSSDLEICSRAIFALGRIQYGKNLEYVTQVIEALKHVVSNDINDQVAASVLKATYALYQIDTAKESEVVDIISSTLNEFGDVTLHAASEIFGFEKSKIPTPILDLLLFALLEVNPNNTGTLDRVDWGLESLVKENSGEKAMIFVETILIKHGQDFPFEILDGFAREVIKNQDGILDRLITRWLLSDKAILMRSIVDLIRDNIGKKFTIRADLSRLDSEIEEQRLLLAKRVCGWFFYQPVCAVSYIISLVDHATVQELSSISDIIFNPLLISYPGSTREYLKSLPDNASEKAKQFSEKLIDKLDTYHDDLRTVQGIKELKPSIAHRETHQRKMNKEMSKSYNEAQKQSVFASLIGRPTVLLYGNSSIHYIHHGLNGETSRQVTPMNSVSTSFEYPSLGHLDPHNLELMLFEFRYGHS